MQCREAGKKRQQKQGLAARRDSAREPVRAVSLSEPIPHFATGQLTGIDSNAVTFVASWLKLSGAEFLTRSAMYTAALMCSGVPVFAP
jgi:hypothetical protein